MNSKKSLIALSRPSTILFATLVLTYTVFGQGVMSEPIPEPPRFPYDLSKQSTSSSLVTVLKSQTLDEAYRPIAPSARLRWFVKSTVGPAHMAGIAFVSALGTAVNRPEEYGPHGGGFVNRLGISMSGAAAGNAMEGSIGLIFREDPRYFRSPRQAFKSRVAHVATLTFLARNESGRPALAYARYLGVVGGNLLSNSWRVHSEANTQAALVRASEGFAGRMAANAFQEFWPDVRRYVFRKHNWLGNATRHD